MLTLYSLFLILISLQIIRYFQLEREDEGTDPLDWWHRNATRFPHLSRMALDYLGIMATSTPSERLFSHAGDVITDRRNRLKPETARHQICLESWWSEDSGLKL